MLPHRRTVVLALFVVVISTAHPGRGRSDIWSGRCPPLVVAPRARIATASVCPHGCRASTSSVCGAGAPSSFCSSAPGRITSRSRRLQPVDELAGGRPAGGAELAAEHKPIPVTAARRLGVPLDRREHIGKFDAQ